MKKYGQYCPIVQAMEVLGDRWTILIVRDMLCGTFRFNDLCRGLPNISRSLLSKRLRQLEDADIIEKHHLDDTGSITEYRLTDAGYELQPVINSLIEWGAKWAFSEPVEEELDPILMMWWIRNRVNVEVIPQDRTVIQFDFQGSVKDSFWLIVSSSDVSMCLTDPGFDIDVLVTCDLSIFYQLWLGRLSYEEATFDHGMRVEGLPSLIRNFAEWFAWSHAAAIVRQVEAQKRVGV